MARRDPFESTPAGKARRLPFPFVLDELAPLDPVTRPMFGALGVYVGERIVMILRDKGPGDADRGVWLAFAPEHEASVVAVLPRLCAIEVFRSKVAGWKKLAARSAEFEDDADLLADLGVAPGGEGDISVLKHVRSRDEVKAAEDLFAAFAFTKNLSLTAAYVDLGDIATFRNQRGAYLSLQAGF